MSAYNVRGLSTQGKPSCEGFVSTIVHFHEQ